MVKHVEDKINLENDTKIALVRFILVVEDSPMYYSRYLAVALPGCAGANQPDHQ
ncbi:MAG: hypothetical protein MZV63_55940 [Marinilabiliales bacterium]|nr:hypothetical protein [Marinilabiliales bacterium]